MSTLEPVKYDILWPLTVDSPNIGTIQQSTGE
jgi:hypothetical protein